MEEFEIKFLEVDMPELEKKTTLTFEGMIKK